MDKKVYTNMIYPGLMIFVVLVILAIVSEVYRCQNNQTGQTVEEYTDSKYDVEHNYSSGDIEINTIIDKESNKEYIMVVKGKEITVVEKTEVMSEDPQEGINNE